MKKIKVDFEKLGRIKPFHAINNAPLQLIRMKGNFPIAIERFVKGVRT